MMFNVRSLVYGSRLSLLLLFPFIQIIGSTGYCQQSFEFTESVPLAIGSDEIVGYDMKRVINDNLYFIRINIFDRYIEEGKVFKLYKVDLKSSQVDSFSIEIPKTKKFHEISMKFISIHDFDIYENDLYILAFGYIIRFEPENDKYSAKDIISIESGFEAMRLKVLSEKKAVISVQYLKPNNSVFIGIVNLRNGKILKYVKPGFDGLIFSPLPDHWCDFSEKNILLASSTSYTIRFFDLNSLRQVDSISFRKEGFDKNPLDSLKKMAFGGKSDMGKIRNLSKQFNRIIKAYYINDTAIVISHLIRGQSNVFLDVWSKSSGSWKLILEDGISYSDSFLDSHDILVNNNFMKLGFGYSLNPVFYQGYILEFSKYSFDPEYFVGRTYGYFVDCIENKQKDTGCLNNVNYQKRALIKYEFILR